MRILPSSTVIVVILYGIVQGKAVEWSPEDSAEAQNVPASVNRIDAGQPYTTQQQLHDVVENDAGTKTLWQSKPSTIAKDLADSPTSTTPTVTPAPTPTNNTNTTTAPPTVTPVPNASAMPTPSPTVPHTPSPTSKTPTPGHTSAPTPSHAGTIAPTVSPAQTPAPTADRNEEPHHKMSFFRIIMKTIAWLIIIALSVLGFGAIMTHRYRIYFFLRGVWYTILRMDCTQWILQRIPFVRTDTHGPVDSTLNTIIFDNEMSEGLLLRPNDSD